MSLVVKEGGSNIAPVPEGVYQAVCVAIYDLGTQFSEKFGKSSHQCLVVWEIGDERITFEKDGQKYDLPRTVVKKYTMSLNEKSNLRKDLQSWRGKAFSPEELCGFDITRLLNANCMIQIIHSKTDTKTYANIASIMPLYKGMEKRKPEQEPVIYQIGEKIPDGTPKWIADMIADSVEMSEHQEPPPFYPEEDVDRSDIPF